jgi:hypothetical protein
MKSVSGFEFQVSGWKTEIFEGAAFPETET